MLTPRQNKTLKDTILDEPGSLSFIYYTLFHMFVRAFFALKMTWRHRVALKQYAHDPALQMRELQALDVLHLKSQGIQVLVLDFDGVLASHGETIPDLALADWLKSCIQVLGEGRVFILSNEPTPARRQYCLEHFPGIIFMPVRRKKPYPDGLLQVQKDTGLEASALLMVDDRLCTGVLAAILAGTRAYWMLNPRVNFKKRPFVESFFGLLRRGEYWLINLLPI